MNILNHSIVLVLLAAISLSAADEDPVKQYKKLSYKRKEANSVPLSGNYGGYPSAGGNNNMGGYPKKQQPMYQPNIKPSYSGQGQYGSNYNTGYLKQSIQSTLVMDSDGNTPNKYVCNGKPTNVPYNCYSEYSKDQAVTLIICPSYTTYTCDQCINNPCQNGGYCYTDSYSNTQCACAFGFTGDRCQTLDLCPGSPCASGMNATCYQLPNTDPNLVNIIDIGVLNPLCKHICVCETTPGSVDPCNVNNYFYVEGKYSIHSGALVDTTQAYLPLSYTQIANSIFTNTIAGVVEDNTDAAALCYDLDGRVVGVAAQTMIGTNTGYPTTGLVSQITNTNAQLSSSTALGVIQSGVITNVYYNDFVGKANIFCPRDKFNVVTCDGARSFTRISQPVVAGVSQSSPSYY